MYLHAPACCYRLDDAYLERSSRVERLGVDGPRGTRRVGVRLIHPPSGVVVEATRRRSLARNRIEAYASLRLQLEALNLENAARGSQMDPGMRGFE